jgi:hypothetical protein
VNGDQAPGTSFLTCRSSVQRAVARKIRRLVGAAGTPVVHQRRQLLVHCRIQLCRIRLRSAEGFRQVAGSLVLKLLRYARRARLPGSGWDQGLGSLASAQAGAPDQPPHDGDGDRAEGEIAAGQEEVEVGNPAPWLIAQGFHKVVLRRAVAVH